MSATDLARSFPIDASVELVPDVRHMFKTIAEKGGKVVGYNRDHVFVRVLWDGLKRPQIFTPRYLRLRPLPTARGLLACKSPSTPDTLGEREP